ncbi:MAG: amidohydrolase [Flavobacteriales bacterium]|nr:amidohydrolase [Flavobacteriales bacterium]MCC6937579.1 amidohydrolase [Flavobacteriales bacterium]
MSDLRVTLVQSMLHWEDAVANRAMFEEKIVGLKGSTDLIVLPEMFTTGFSMRSAELAETMDGATVAWMREQARTVNAAIYGSAIITEGGKQFNRGLFVKPDGKVTIYDKRHLFRFANETDHYSPGKDRVVVEWRGWRLLLQVCFDLRFPVFSRNRGDYDAILYVANWPEARRFPWSQLLIARAIENQCYVAGVNRVGMDGKGIHYSGDSVMIDPRGAVIGEVEPSQEGVAKTIFGREALDDFREKFPAGMEADNFDPRF